VDEAAIIRALELNLVDLWSRFGRGDGCELHETETATWFDTPIRSLPYNCVLRFVAAGDADAQIDAIFDHYRKRGVPFAWIVHPSAQPADLADRLKSRGFEEADVVPGMSMDLADLPDESAPPPGVTIREVETPSELAAFFDLIAWRWNVAPESVETLHAVSKAFLAGAPGGPIRAWIATANGETVSKVILNLAAGVAGIYGVATRPEARGLGLARALTLRALHEARKSGYRHGVLHSTAMARGIYEKIGFRAHADFRIFAPPASFHL
jgi:GNAT superfamily N-acetyltransferase